VDNSLRLCHRLQCNFGNFNWVLEFIQSVGIAANVSCWCMSVCASYLQIDEQLCFFSSNSTCLTCQTSCCCCLNYQLLDSYLLHLLLILSGYLDFQYHHHHYSSLFRKHSLELQYADLANFTELGVWIH